MAGETWNRVYTLREGDGVFIGTDENLGIVMLLNEICAPTSIANFLISEHPGLSNFDTPDILFERQVTVCPEVSVIVRLKGGRNDRISAKYFFPSDGPYVWRLDREKIGALKARKVY